MYILGTMRFGVTLRWVGTALLAACGGTATGPGDLPPGPGEPRDVTSVRLFDASGVELTQHVPLIMGATVRVDVRLYAANGRQITSVTGGEELTFAFDPPSLASATPVAAAAAGRHVIGRTRNRRHAGRHAAVPRRRIPEDVWAVRRSGALNPAARAASSW